jgi:hypothetical protein
MGALSSMDRRARAWEDLAGPPAPRDRFVAPENHWPQLVAAPLELRQRHGLNNFALRFSCEMVTHFERYVVEWIDRHPRRLGDDLKARAARRFADEERRHIAGFHRLLHALSPEHYRDGELRFFRWGWWDRMVVRLSPAVTFFVATDLLEEMFLHLHHVMEEQPEQSMPFAREVMAMHARDERGHLAMDELVIRKRAARTWRPWFALQALAALLILVVVDRKTQRAWRRSIRAECDALAVTPPARRALAQKGLSVSDVRGLRAFIARRRERPFPGSRLLCWILARALPRR